MIFKISNARRSYTPLSSVQHAERTKRAHLVTVRAEDHSTTVMVSKEVYDNALQDMHGGRFYGFAADFLTLGDM